MSARGAVPLKFEQTGDRSLERMQRATQVVQQQMNDSPAVGGAVLGPFNFTSLAGSTVTLRIPHKLGRRPTAWWLVDVTGDYVVAKRTAWDADTITLALLGYDLFGVTASVSVYVGGG